MSRRGCCEQTFIDLRLHAWCGGSSLLPRTGAEVEEIIVSYEVQVQNEWTSSSFSPGGNHHFLTERFDTNFAISQEQSVPVATQRSAFLCQYSYWAERSIALRVFDPIVCYFGATKSGPSNISMPCQWFGCRLWPSLSSWCLGSCAWRPGRSLGRAIATCRSSSPAFWHG